jgi:GLPGLI family protein
LKKLTSILFCLLVFQFVNAQQRIVAECTVVYKVESISDGGLVQEKALKTVYIKSNNARIDLVAPAYVQTTIYNKTTVTATLLRSFGEDKYMTSLNTKQWRKVNAPLDSIQIQFTTDSISILDYACKKALLQLKNGDIITVYYTSSIIPSVREYEYMFKDIPGFVLGYEMTDNAGVKTIFKATQINLYNPVAASKFDIPTKDYRVIPVE